MSKDELIEAVKVAIRVHRERENSSDKFVAGIAGGKVEALEWVISAVKLLEVSR